MVVDHEQRRQALDASQSFICEAPAGSGKTELLTQRFLVLLSYVKNPEEILAMTFTRKAAAEMRSRIVRALHMAATEPEPESAHQKTTWQLARAALKQDQAFGWCLREMPSRLQIKTFDSLCSSLANTLPLHSSFAAPPKVTEDADELYQFAVRNFLASVEGSDPWSDSLAHIMRLLDNNTDKVERLFIRMIAQREAWLPLFSRHDDMEAVTQALESNLQCVRDETVVQLKKAIPFHLRQQILHLAEFAASNLKKTHPRSSICHCADLDLLDGELPGADELGIKQWSGLVMLLLTFNGRWRKTLDRRTGFPQGEGVEKAAFKEKKIQCLALIEELSHNEDLLTLLQDIRRLPSASYEQDQRVLLQELLKVLPVLSAYLSLAFQEKKCVDFPEVSLKARFALGKFDSPTDLALALDHKINHILVDEFQDTSPSQIALLNLLTSGWQVGDGKSLFCVGDAMQSIYGFRNANVGLFLQCIERGLDNVPLTHLRLSANFRSQAGVVKWVNRVFSVAFPQHNDIALGAISYSPSVAVREKLEERAVWTHGFAEGTERYDEARTVLGIVRKTLHDHPDKNIGILVRNRTHIAHITPLLDEAGVKYQAVDMEPLANNVTIQDLIALTHSLLRLEDRVSWLSVLRAPWSGISLVDLEAIASVTDDESRPLTVYQQLQRIVDAQETVSSSSSSAASASQSDMFIASAVEVDGGPLRQLTPDGKARLNRVFPILQSALNQSNRKSLRQWVEGAWIALGGPACLGDAQSLKNATVFFSLLEDIEESGALRREKGLERAIQNLFSVPDPDANKNVQIMTIHKSKGLEFDTVIVPSLQRSPRSADPELLRWYERLSDDGRTRLMMSPVTTSGKDMDPVEFHMREQEKRRTINENARLMYVACTRARERLHLLAQIKTDKKNTLRLRSPAKSSLLHTIWEPIQSRIKVYTKVVEPECDTVAEPEKPRYLQRLPSTWTLPALEKGTLLEQYIPFFKHENDEAARVEGEGGEVKVGEIERVEVEGKETARVAGTLAHRILNTLTLTQVQQWASEGVSQFYDRWRAQLINLGVPRANLETALAHVQVVIQHVVEDESARWLFESNIETRKTEFPITVSSGTHVNHYVVDLLLVKDGVTWVVDYKTSQPAKAQDQSAFLASEKWTYQKIMFQYGDAVAKLGYRNIRLALYFPMISTWVEYD